MALTELEIKRCDKAVSSFLERRRPPPEIREKIDLACKIDGHSVEVRRFHVQKVTGAFSAILSIPAPQTKWLWSWK